MRRRFNQFFLALALVTLVATITSTLTVYTVAERSHRRRVESLSLSLLRQTMTVFETAHISLVSDLFLLYNDSTLRPLLHAREPSAGTVLRAAEEVDESLVSAPYIDTVFAYNSWAGTFYSTSDGLMSYAEASDLPILPLLQNVLDYQLYSYVPLSAPASDGAIAAPSLAVVVGNRPYEGSRMASSIIATIDERALRETIIGASEAIAGEGTIISDRNGLVISHPDPARFGTRLTSDPSLAPVLEKNDASGWLTTERDGERYLTAFVRHPTMGWLFLRRTPVSDLLSDLRAARNSIFLIVLAVVIALLLWDYFLSELLSRRIKALARTARTLNVRHTVFDGQVAREVSDGELQEVESALQFAHERLEQLEAGERLSQENALRSVLRRFLESPLEPELDTAIEQQSLGALQSARFVVVLLSVDEYRQLLLKRGRTRIDRMRREAAKRLHGRTEDRTFTFMLRPEEVLVLRQVSIPYPTSATVREWVAQADETSGSFSVAFASRPVDIQNLSETYESLQASIAARFFLGHHAVIEKAEETWTTSRYDEYPQNAIDRLIQRTLLGEHEEAIEEFDRAFNSLSNDPPAAALLARLMVTSLTREIRARHGDEVEFPPDFSKLQSFADYADTLTELRRIVRYTVYHLSRQMDSSTVSRHREIVEQAMKIVEEEYNDPAICDDAVADRLRVSIQHLRTVFKQYRRASLSKEITRLRLQESRRLLVTTRMPAKEVARSVGFGSANYFLTLFKKEYGMTPTSYRRRHHDTADVADR
ncbi:MAG: AraC family transcriptional regulator [Spirochaetota bacterium]